MAPAYRHAGRAIPKPSRRSAKPRKPIRRSKRPAYLRVRRGAGKIRKLADDAMSLYVRCRGGWRCAKCGTDRNIQCCHIIPKGAYPSGRYRDDNAMALCQGHHRYYTARFMEWREWIGPDAHDGLHKLITQGMVKWDCAEEARRYLLLVARFYPEAQERLEALNKRAEALELWK